MNLDKLNDLISAGRVHEGDVFSFTGKGIVGTIINLFAGSRTHVGQVFKLTAELLALLRKIGMAGALTDADVGRLCLFEYGFELGVAGGAFVTELTARLAGESGRVYFPEWGESWDAAEIELGLNVWRVDIRDKTPYGVDIIVQFAPWLTAVAFYQTGAGRFLPWRKWRLANLLANPPRPILVGKESEEVCSPEVAHACKAAGRFLGDPDGQTPLMVASWLGFKPEVELT